MTTDRFEDKNYRLTDFENEVWIACPNCGKQAIARIAEQEKQAKLSCIHCGFHKTCSMEFTNNNGKILVVKQAAHFYFEARLWFLASFKNNLFWAYNPEHLNYLETYISAKLREHKNRSHFTLLEKLPKFYHEAKNREGLLKLIAKLKVK